MNVKNQLLIDKYIAKPTVFLLNFLVRIVGKLTSINHDLNTEFKTIAICKFKGMGSILQATPMIEAIRCRYPNAQIIFVSTKSNMNLLEKIDWIDTIITVDDSNFLKFVKTNIRSIFLLMRIRPELYIDLEIYSDYSTLFSLFTLSKNRIGFYLRSSSFRMGIYTHMMFFNPRVPISNVYLQIAQLIGCDTENKKLFPLKSNNLTTRKHQYLVINPNASDLRLERKWGKDKFIELIQIILQNYSEFDILLIGGKDEVEYTTEIEKAINSDRVFNTSGKTSIDELVNIITHAKLMISNDTGPMHIAFCTNTPIICLFGPCSPEQYGINNEAHIIYKNAYCSPCVHDFEIPPCKGNNVCMHLIPVNEVFEKTKALIDNQTSLNSQKMTDFIYKVKNNVLGKVYR